MTEPRARKRGRDDISSDEEREGDSLCDGGNFDPFLTDVASTFDSQLAASKRDEMSLDMLLVPYHGDADPLPGLFHFDRDGQFDRY